MTTRLAGGFFALSIVAMGQGASATPPDIIDVRDELFGVSACCVLLLRETDDNLGVYDAFQKDTLLVSIDRESGETTQKPVYRAMGRADYERDELGEIRLYSGETLPGSVEPFAALAGMSGAPARAGAGAVHDEAGPVREGDGLSMSFRDGPAVRASVSALMRRFQAALDETVKIVGDYERLATIPTRELFAGLARDPAGCRFDRAYRLDDRVGAPIILLRAICGEETGEGIASLLLPLPEE
ncbi:MAG: hypothetical protein ACK5MQ_15610 [Pikeienuella sp.]